MSTTTVEQLLDILIEECAEVIQRATKAKRFGITEVQPGHTQNATQRLNYELNDLAGVVALLQEQGVDLEQVPELITAKKEKVRHFLGYSQEQGTIDDTGGGGDGPEFPSAELLKQGDIPWCEPCGSYHVVPKDAEHKALLQCQAEYRLQLDDDLSDLDVSAEMGTKG